MKNTVDTLPDVPDLAKKLGHPDPLFDAWRDRQDKRSWVRLDLSALRIGYELGLCAASNLTPEISGERSESAALTS